MTTISAKESMNSILPFMQGGGNMGKLIRAKDWSTTPLGNPETWQHSLRTMVSMMLHNPIGMYLMWGDDHIQLYNDAYRPVLGKSKHPEALGIPARITFRETWNSIEPLIKRAMKGEPIRLPDFETELHRNGFPENCYFDFSYTPIFQDNGEVGGVVATVIETTQRKRAELAVKESNNQLAFAIEATELGTFDYNPKNHTFSGNERLKAWFGLPPKSQLDIQDGIDAIADEDKERVEKEISRALEFESGGNYNIVYTIIHPESGSRRIVKAKGRAWFNDAKEAIRFNGTLQDITASEKITRKIEESERRFRESVKQAPLGIAIFRGENYSTELVNDTYLQMIEKTEENFLGRSLFDALPELRETIEPLFHDVMTSGKPFASTEMPVILDRFGSEDLAYFNFVYHPLKESDGKITGIMVVATEVTESVNAKKALQQSEEHFRTLVNQSPIGMAVLRGHDLVIEMANTKMLEGFWKKKFEEVIGKKTLDVFPELSDQQYPDLFNQILKEGKKISKNEEVALIKHGDKLTRFYFDFEYAPLLELGGAVSGVIVTAVDVTAKVNARKQLENAEERIRLATESTELATWELFLDKKELIHSPRLAEIFGHPPDTILSHEKLRSQVLFADLDEIVLRSFREALKSGVYKYEARILKPDGSISWVRTQGKVFYNSDSTPQKIIGTLRDITEEMQQQQALQDSEQRFRTLADSMPQFVWTGDKDGNLNYFSNSVFDYSGMTEAELIGGGWINMMHPDDRERNISKWMHSIETGSNFICEHRFLRHDGDYRWQLSRAIPQRDTHGNILMWVGASNDIHDMKEVDQQKDFFISMASHELKTPITSIKGYVQILQSMYQENGDEFLNKSLNIVDKQLVTLTGLISDLLDLSKIKSGSLVLDKSRFSVNTFLNDIISEIRQINPDCTILFNEIKDEDIFADRDRLGQVLINLLTNAIKYSPADCEVHVRNEYRNGNLIVTVRDGGIGISKKDQHKIFERFYRVEGKDEKTYPGFGIGLNIAAVIIDRHDGEISVKSEVGEGSEFHFSIPLQSN